MDDGRGGVISTSVEKRAEGPNVDDYGRLTPGFEIF
jgi:hypothetical protein